MGRSILAVALMAVAAFLLAPVVLVTAFFAVAIVVFIANCALKFGAFAQSLRGAALGPEPPSPHAHVLHQPTVSIIVPLFREPEVAGALVDRLRDPRFYASRIGRTNHRPHLRRLIQLVAADDRFD